MAVVIEFPAGEILASHPRGSLVFRCDRPGGPISLSYTVEPFESGHEVGEIHLTEGAAQRLPPEFPGDERDRTQIGKAIFWLEHEQQLPVILDDWGERIRVSERVICRVIVLP